MIHKKAIIGKAFAIPIRPIGFKCSELTLTSSRITI